MIILIHRIYSCTVYIIVDPSVDRMFSKNAQTVRRATELLLGQTIWSYTDVRESSISEKVWLNRQSRCNSSGLQMQPTGFLEDMIRTNKQTHQGCRLQHQGVDWP